MPAKYLSNGMGSAFNGIMKTIPCWSGLVALRPCFMKILFKEESLPRNEACLAKLFSNV